MDIRWTAPVAAALESIVDYIAKDNPQAADRVAQRIRIAVSQLTDHPRLGRTGRIRGNHELIIHRTPYIVPYRIRKHEVQILSVYHASRKWPETFG